MSQTLTDLFLDRYKQLEQSARMAFGLDEGESVLNYLKHNRRFSHLAEQLDYCREVRNLLAHNPKVEGDFAVAASQGMVDFIDDVIASIEHRQRCFAIATTGKAIVRRSFGDRVLDAVQIMRAQQFSYLPLVEGKRVVGVFDERSLFGFVADNGSVGVDDTLTFSDIAAYCTLERADTEVFGFYPRSMYVDELVTEFEMCFGQGKRLCAAFLTEHGKPEEALLGIVTAWDVLGKGKPRS